jgi:hypothetical protein
MLEVDFAGWSQVRLATDPDPFDEIRGISGWTFALPREPDLDRVLRFQPPGTTRRVGGPKIGVGVIAVRDDGSPARRHPLRRARADLLGAPVFEGKNTAVAGAGSEPIFPFELELAGADVRLRRAMVDDRGAPLLKLSAGQEGGPDTLVTAGVRDVRSYRMARRQVVDAALGRADPSGPVAFGLRKRMARWGSDDVDGQPPPLFWGPVPAVGRVRYAYELNGPATASGAGRTALGPIDRSAPWPVSFWVGCFDADVLCAFVSGTLSIPRR